MQKKLLGANIDGTYRMRTINWHTYIIVLVITTFIFGTAFLLSDFFYQRRIEQVKAIEAQLSLSVLATEVEYNLLADTICESEASALSEELNSLGQKLGVMEEVRGISDAEVIGLKQQYSLLQIKDYLLQKERARQCGERPNTILYFYSNKGNCADCARQGYVLTGLRQDYPDLHVYSFDYNLDLSAIRTLRGVYKMGGELPALVINRVPNYGFRDRTAILDLLPALPRTASSTKATSTNIK